ncbi:MAG: domain containing protein [Phycisphaerales bacterium]|nr:domain containing protein [Phycisphaerales bacterium]
MIHRYRQVWLSCVVVVVGLAGLSEAATVTLSSNKDNSIYSESDASNGVGPGMFAGVTPNSVTRRGLFAFDLSSIPAGATITAVKIDLTQTKIGPGQSATFELHPLSAAWGEGTSLGSGAGGLASTGDATWNFRSYNTTSWTNPGGDFGPTSATAALGTTNGVYSFTTQPALVADVQHWLDTPATNFGWLLKAATETGVSAREFGTREGTAGTAPSLTITYSVPEPASGLCLVPLARLAARRRRAM